MKTLKNQNFLGKNFNSSERFQQRPKKQEPGAVSIEGGRTSIERK